MLWAATTNDEDLCEDCAVDDTLLGHHCFGIGCWTEFRIVRRTRLEQRDPRVDDNLLFLLLLHVVGRHCQVLAHSETA